MPWKALVGLLLLGASTGCAGDEAGVSRPAPADAAFGEFDATVQTVQSRYLDANEPALRSLAVLGPYIEASLGSAALRNAGEAALRNAGEAAPAAGATCLDPILAGRTLEFDGSLYQAGDSSGAPADGVRFLLYEVNAAGTPDLTRPLGYLEIVCRSGQGIQLEVTLASRGVEILGAVASGAYPSPTNLEIGGFFREPTGEAPWLWGGSLVGNQFAFTADLPGRINALYAVLNQPGSAPDNVLVQAIRSRDALEWELYADILAADTGEIEDGPVRFTTPDGTDLAACTGGTVDWPVFLSPAVGGCSYFNLSSMEPGQENLAVLQRGYLVLRDLYVLSRDLVGTGLGAVHGIP